MIVPGTSNERNAF